MHSIQYGTLNHEVTHLIQKHEVLIQRILPANFSRAVMDTRSGDSMFIYCLGVTILDIHSCIRLNKCISRSAMQLLRAFASHLKQSNDDEFGTTT